MGQNQDIFLFRFLTVFETHLTIFMYFLESWNIFFDGFWFLWCISDQVLGNFYPFDYICLSHFSLKIHKYHAQTFFKNLTIFYWSFIECIFVWWPCQERFLSLNGTCDFCSSSSQVRQQQQQDFGVVQTVVSVERDTSLSCR